MTTCTIIFPHQLFEHHPAILNETKVYLVEEYLFFNQYNFHKQKLVLHRSSMQQYYDYLKSLNIDVDYISAYEPSSDVRVLIKHLSSLGIVDIHVVDVCDDWLSRRLVKVCKKYKLNLQTHASPNFLNTMDDVKPFFDDKKTYFQTTFYIAQRKTRNILLESNGNPVGGQWSFDADNRQKYPKKTAQPVVVFPSESKHTKAAKTYVDRYFPDNYGSIQNFVYPTNYAEAHQWLDQFFATRFQKFGIYEDALVTDAFLLHHSGISPLLNIGLLQPQDVVNKALQVATQYDIPLNSLEGFIRQVIGWREFIRIVYEREGSYQRTKHFWGFTRKVPKSFWTGETGIGPIDITIKKILNTGYCHHIERLMVLGNFMLLCEFDPDDVYRWFMEMFVDSYDWVMVPNVYGMTQFADGGLMTTKPYISGSNYLLKMSDYEKGMWTNVWDGLFWRFLHTHRSFFQKNPRLGMLINTFDKMPEEKQRMHLTAAEDFLAQMDKT
jgi:deoxyribodipyrimidine photolyase-related protein